MAANMKAVKLRIKSVQSTMQITKAMELVASSKLRKAKERAETCRPYFKKLHETLKDIAGGNTDFTSAYAREAANARYAVMWSLPVTGVWPEDTMPIFLNVWRQTARRQGLSWFCRWVKKAVEYCQTAKNVECLTEQFAEIADISVADCFEIANLLCRGIQKGNIWAC